MGLTRGVKSHRLSGQISPYCEKKTSLALRVLRAYVYFCCCCSFYTAISIKVVGSSQAYVTRLKGSVGSCKSVLVLRL